jgi:hypothetical protein
MTGVKMKETRIKSAKFIFAQLQKVNKLPKDDVFNASAIDLSDIDDAGLYYAGFVFSSSAAQTYVASGVLSSAADASHCEGITLQSFGTYSAVVGYDWNNSILTLVSGHVVGNEDSELWRRNFDKVKSIPGFDVPGRVTLVDMEKGIGSAFNEVMEHATLFYDERHFLKNMASFLGNSDKGAALRLFSQAMRAPSRELADAARARFSVRQEEYVSRFPPNQLFKAYVPVGGLCDLVKTSQGAESAMNAALTNGIRSAEPMSMLKAIAESDCAKMERKKVPRFFGSEHFFFLQ